MRAAARRRCAHSSMRVLSCRSVTSWQQVVHVARQDGQVPLPGAWRQRKLDVHPNIEILQSCQVHQMLRQAIDGLCILITVYV